MTGGDKLGLPKDLDAAGDLVAQLRRRQQVEQRIEAAARQAEDLQQQAQELVDEQVVPIGLFSWLMAVFVVGFVALAAWWLVPAAIARQIRRLDRGDRRRRLDLRLAVQISSPKTRPPIASTPAIVRSSSCSTRSTRPKRSRHELDRELPLTDGSVATAAATCRAAPGRVGARCCRSKASGAKRPSEIDAAERRLKLAEEKHAAALANWKAKLRALGLPDDSPPANLATMAGQCERLAELEARIENRRDDMARRQREFAIVSQRIVALAEETGLRAREGQRRSSSSIICAAEYRKQHASASPAATELRERAKELQAEEVKHARAAIGYRRRREALFQKCGVADEQELRQLAAQLDEAEELRKKRAAVTREIAAAIGKHGTEADFAPLLAADAIGRLGARLGNALHAIGRARPRTEGRSAAARRAGRAAAGRSRPISRSPRSRSSSTSSKQQIKKATRAWRERAAVSLFLERIREDYEQHRQPETLQEASGYLTQLTGGKYTRIWTPLAHDILFVDNADGQPLPVQVLSRGTREQLFVSLRLALVAAYARRGIHLPMILDDVFVNFDAGRTKTACAVLRDFAKQGHQLLVFTCHEHVWRMFQDLKVDARRIPNRYGEVEEEDVVAERGPEPVAIAAARACSSSRRRLSNDCRPPPPIVIEDEVDEEPVEEFIRARATARTDPRRSGILVAGAGPERCRSHYRTRSRCAQRLASRAGHLSGAMVALVSRLMRIFRNATGSLWPQKPKWPLLLASAGVLVAVERLLANLGEVGVEDFVAVESHRRHCRRRR